MYQNTDVFDNVLGVFIGTSSVTNIDGDLLLANNPEIINDLECDRSEVLINVFSFTPCHPNFLCRFVTHQWRTYPGQRV